MAARSQLAVRVACRSLNIADTALVKMLLVVTVLFLGTAHAAQSAVETSVPISAGTGTNIASDLFPVTVKLTGVSLYISDPALDYSDPRRIGLRVRFQAYDYRPEEDIAFSEFGRALVSGELGYDAVAREVLLHDPRLDVLEFDRENAATRRLSASLRTAWSDRVTSPVRSELPPHPYLLPFRSYIGNLFYDGKAINLVLSSRPAPSITSAP